MSNAPRRAKADKNKYEGKAFLTYAEAEDYLGIKHTTLYHYLIDLEIDTRKFKKDRKRYIAIADVKRIERVIEEPWLLESEEERDDPEAKQEQKKEPAA